MSGQRRGSFSHDEMEVWLARPRSHHSKSPPRTKRHRVAALTKPLAAPNAEDGPRKEPPRYAGGRPRDNGPGNIDRGITRGYVAFVLGIDVSTVRRLEARGELHPRVGQGGVRYFDSREVLALKSRRLGMTRDRTTEIRLAAFGLFEQGVDWRAAAIRLHYDPYRVYRLWRLYSIDAKDGAAEDD